MMLRTRNQNTQAAAVTKNGKGIVSSEGPTKRLAKQGGQGEPQPKKAVLAEISNGISNFLIDSSKKVLDQKKSLKQRNAGRNTEDIKKNIILEGGSDALEPVIEEVKKVKQPSVDPCPEFDFDKDCLAAKDDFSVPTFAFDIFRYYRSRETKFAIGDYMYRHPKLSKDVRCVLVDWMVEVQESFELNHETLYLAVKLVDTYLSRTRNVDKDDLQLIGSACFFIASKFDERSPPLIDDFMYLCEDNFDRDQLIKMEMKVLDTVGFDLGCPLSYRYLRRYARVTSTDMGTLTLSRFILELSLCYYEFVGVRESLLASGAFFLALKMKDPNAEWTKVLQKYSEYTVDEVLPVMNELNHMLHLKSSNKLSAKIDTVFSKYSHPVFHEVALIPLFPGAYEISRPLKSSFST